MADPEPDEVRPRRALIEEPPAGDGSERARRGLPGAAATQVLTYPRRSADPVPVSDLDPGPDAGDLERPSRVADQPPRRPRRGRRGRRNRLALAVAGVAVVVVGLVISHAVLSRPTPAGAGQAGATRGSAQARPAQLLTDAMMLTAAQTQQVDASRTWKVAGTQHGLDDQSPQPACLGSAAQGQGSDHQAPVAQQTFVRLLSSSGSRAPALLHQADAYATAREASQAYERATQALGGCPTPGAYLESGYLVTGLGDQAVAAVVRVPTKSAPAELRSVVLSRTGRVVNVVDVAQERKPAAVPKVAQALAAAADAQCGAAGGRCSTTVGVTAGPPPPGSGEPGFLAAADLPPIGPSLGTAATWEPTAPGVPAADFAGSGCESVSWAKVPARQRQARTYLDSEVKALGLDEIILTESSDQAAQALVAKVKADLDSCARRSLTATVSGLYPLAGTGAARSAVRGWTATVAQKTTDGVARYRVGMVSAGAKTVFTFLNPQPRLDLTDSRWRALTLRAGQRAAQVR